MSKTLVVIEDYPSHTSQFGIPRLLNRWASRLLAWEVRRAYRDRLESGTVFLCSQEVHDRLKPCFPNQVISTSGIRDLDETPKEDLHELLNFNGELIRRLGEEPGCRVRGISIPQAVAFSLAEPYSEDVPFLINGIAALLKRERITRVIQAGSAGESDLRAFVSATARAAQVSVSSRTFLAVRALDVLFRVSRTLGFPLRWIRLAWTYSRGRSAQLPPEPEPVIWLTAIRPRNLLALLPISKQLNALKRPNRIVCALEDAQAPPSGLRTHSLVVTRQLSRSKRIRIFFRCSILLHKAWKKVAPTLGGPSWTYKGVPIANLVLPRLRRVLAIHGPPCAILIEGAHAAFRSSPPSGVIVSEPTELCFAALEFAHASSLPSLQHIPIDDGYTSTNSLWSHFITSPNVATLNFNQRDLVSRLKKGPQSNDIRVVGNLNQDSIQEDSKAEIRSKVRGLLKLDQRPLLLVGSRHASSIFHLGAKQKYFELIARAVRSMDIQATVRCHPHERVKQTQRELRSWGIAWPVVGAETPLSFFELSAASDFVCNIEASSSSMEALLARTPVIIVNPGHTFQSRRVVTNTSYVEAGAAVRVTDTQKLSAELHRLKTDPRYGSSRVSAATEFIERFNGPQDGKASLRMSDFLTKVFSATDG